MTERKVSPICGRHQSFSSWATEAVEEDGTIHDEWQKARVEAVREVFTQALVDYSFGIKTTNDYALKALKAADAVPFPGEENIKCKMARLYYESGPDVNLKVQVVIRWDDLTEERRLLIRQRMDAVFDIIRPWINTELYSNDCKKIF